MRILYLFIQAKANLKYGINVLVVFPAGLAILGTENYADRDIPTPTNMASQVSLKTLIPRKAGEEFCCLCQW